MQSLLERLEYTLTEAKWVIKPGRGPVMKSGDATYSVVQQPSFGDNQFAVYIHTSGEMAKSGWLTKGGGTRETRTGGMAGNNHQYMYTGANAAKKAAEKHAR